MKILFIHSALKPDYLSDAVLHGLKELYGNNVTESNLAWYLYDDINLLQKHRLWGRGFTLYGKLPSASKVFIPHHLIHKKIRNQYYDQIIFGSVWRNLDYLELVQDHYPKSKVVFIDGEDHCDIKDELLGSGTYYKRELVTDDPRIRPISFAIPSKLVLKRLPIKKRVFAKLIPGDLSTYTFHLEKSYYKSYQNAVFGFTCKKGGWDCLRHYEILMNGCIPYFHDLASCPIRTMVNFPKDELVSLDYNSLRRNPNDMITYLLDYARNHLTTYTLAESMLNRC